MNRALESTWPCIGPKTLPWHEAVVDSLHMSNGNDKTEQSGSWKPVYGTYAQFVSAVVASLALILTLYFHYSEGQSKASDEHVGKLISEQVKTATRDIDDYIGKQLTPISSQLGTLTQQVGQLQGRFQQLDNDQKKLSGEQQKLSNRVGQQDALNRIQDPNRILGLIRTDIKLAQDRQAQISASQLADYKAALRGLPTSAKEYWTTVAEVINYQSLVNQMSGEAPDPSKVARPCITGSGNPNVIIENNFYNGGVYRNCFVNLDNQAFVNVTFQNSVIRYKGGPATLRNVRFINCRFDLNFPTESASPPQQNLLLALLNSSDQKTVQVESR